MNYILNYYCLMEMHLHFLEEPFTHIFHKPDKKNATSTNNIHNRREHPPITSTDPCSCQIRSRRSFPQFHYHSFRLFSTSRTNTGAILARSHFLGATAKKKPGFCNKQGKMAQHIRNKQTTHRWPSAFIPMLTCFGSFVLFI